MADQEALEKFRSFDWDGSQQWLDHLHNIEVPDGRSDALLKVKAKWFKRTQDSNLNLEDIVKPAPSSYNSSSYTQSNPSSTPSGPTPAAQEEPKPAPPSRAPQQQTRGSATQLDAKAVQTFFSHCMLLVLAVAYIIPFHPWSRPAYRYFNLLTIITQGNKLLHRHGWPTIRPLSRLQEWAAQAFSTTDFQYLMMAVMFMPQPPMTMAIMPMVVLSVYHVFAHVAQHLAGWGAIKPLWDSHGRKLHQLLIKHQHSALVANATAEISVGFMLVAQLLTPARNFILLYLYWNMLKMRYWSRDASSIHRQAWQALNARTRPYRAMLPVVEKPIGFVQKWFNTPR